jgi:hypothetical protein
MKGAVGLGLLVGIVGSIFLPHVFALISGDSFFTFNAMIVVVTSGSQDALSGIFSCGFPNPFIGAFPSGLISPLPQYVFNPNILGLFIPGPVTHLPSNIFFYFLPAMLNWLVCGLLSSLFSQSVKKGVLSAVVFVVVEVLVYMLLKVIAGKDLLTDVIMAGGDPYTFIGGAIITPVAFSIVGGVLGGLISRFAFGPEEI